MTYTQNDESYNYDLNGNRTGGSYQTATNNRTTEDATWVYAYDDEGNIISKTHKTSGEIWEYDRLTNSTKKTASGIILTDLWTA